ncbi:MAG: hypothetical protein WA126_14350 [Thermodesulfovibrionales bacterium]
MNNRICLTLFILISFLMIWNAGYADAYPSLKDINLAFYEDSLYVIASQIHEKLFIKAFGIRQGIVSEVKTAGNLRELLIIMILK